MLPLKRVIAVGILCAVILNITLLGSHAADEAASALERAETALASSYLAVSEAEKAGANVTVLLRKLNDAGLFLDKAHQEYRVGNLSGSIYFAEISYNISSETASRAIRLKDLAASEAARNFWFAVATSSVSIGAIVFLSSRLWRRFKHWYQAQERELVR